MTFLQDIKYTLLRLKDNSLIRQTGIYSLMQVFSLGMAFLINIFLAKEMGPDLFGIYSFSVAVMTFVGLFFEFGLFSTAAKILADNRNAEEERHWVGAFFCIFFIIYGGMALFILLLSCFIDDVFSDKIGNILAQISICSYVYILPFFVESILKGCNKIYTLSGFNFLQRILALLLICVIWSLDLLSPLSVLYMIGISYLLSLAYIFFSLRPRFDNVFAYIKNGINYNKEYGWPIYWGRVAGAAAYNVDKLLISYFIDARTVGFYTIAYSFASPMLTISNALSVSIFRRLAGEMKIHTNFIRRNLQALGVSVIAMLLIGYATLVLYLSGGYAEAFSYLVILALAMSFQGAYGLYNTWLSGHGYAKIKRDIALRIGCMDIISNFFLIMWFGAYGGCIAAVLDMSYSYYLYKRAYERIIRNEV